MAGYNAVLEFRRLEKAIDDLGFMLCAPKHGSWGSEDTGDRVAIKPKDTDSLPIYSRDAEVFTGTLEQLQTWIRGVAWAREYDMMLKLSDDRKRQRKEQDARNQQLVRILKNEKAEYKGN